MRALVSLALVLTLIAASAWMELDRRWHQPLVLPEQPYYLEVAAGESLRSVARRLERQGVLADPWLLLAYGRWSGLDVQIKRGEYRLAGPLTAKALLTQLAAGKVIQYQVTLPEGITLAQALALLARHDSVTKVLQGPQDPRIQTLIKPHLSPEGLFFPDSYAFERGASDWQLLQRAHLRMQHVLAQEWRERAPGLPYETAYEALIMASIIERETGLAQERAEIAGVFVRRLDSGMRLQTDPTVIYGLGSSYDGNLRRVHLKDASNPYNTYRHRGLPPSPIALAGQAAIHAALHPAEGDTLYFVARGDGGHVFTATLAEHQQAVRKYQLRRKKDYHSSPEKP